MGAIILSYTIYVCTIGIVSLVGSDFQFHSNILTRALISMNPKSLTKNMK